MTVDRRPLVIAVDGPAGSGKSSVSRGVASRLDLRYLDTGAMYRAVTWGLLEAGVVVEDSEQVAREAGAVRITSTTDPRNPGIEVDGRDVSSQIRSAEVTAAVSAVSAVPSVRALLLELQREAVLGALRDGTGIVVEGRDIGSVVLPDADLKIYLTADPEERARRRSAEATGDGAGPGGLAATQQRLLERDAKDSSRAVAPLAVAPDATVLDTTDMSLPEVIDVIVGLAQVKAT